MQEWAKEKNLQLYKHVKWKQALASFVHTGMAIAGFQFACIYCINEMFDLTFRTVSPLLLNSHMLAMNLFSFRDNFTMQSPYHSTITANLHQLVRLCFKCHKQRRVKQWRQRYLFYLVDELVDFFSQHVDLVLFSWGKPSVQLQPKSHFQNPQNFIDITQHTYRIHHQVSTALPTDNKLHHTKS